RTAELLAALAAANQTDAGAAATFARLLPMQSPSELKAARSRVAQFTTGANGAEVRQAAWAALALADGSFDAAWTEAAQSPASLADLLSGIPQLLDPDFRSLAYDKVKPLLSDLPAADDTLGKLRRAAIRAAVSMSRDQEATFTALVNLIAKRDQVPAAARGLRVLPRTTWPKAQAASAAGALVAWAKTVPASDRTAQDYIETVQFAGDLAGFLPPNQAVALRRQLRELRLSVSVIRTVCEQMRYDTR